MSMVAKKNLLTILTLFAQRQNSAHIRFSEFTDYMRCYAQHHIEDQPELSPFLTNPESAMQDDIIKLVEQHSIIITSPDTEKKKIIVIPFYVEKYANRYRKIMNNSTIPFPVATDISKQTPSEIINRQQAATFLGELFDNLLDNSKKHEINEQNDPNEQDSANTSKTSLYGLVFPHDIPVILLPSITPVTVLFDAALAKIREMLRNEKFHYYFLKKLTMSNPGKELSVKSFFTQFIQRPSETLESIKLSGEFFYFWNQLCFFIRQDHEKLKDYTQEDIAILQSIYITEYLVSYYKKISQQTLQHNTALRNLEKALDKPPYYFTKDTIELFTDSLGIPLLGKYSPEELNEFLYTATISSSDTDLPTLVTFKIHTGQRYYIYTSKVLPLLERLCNDAQKTIKRNLTKTWFDIYRNFDSVAAMREQKAFEKCLENEIKTLSPILYALLNSNFLLLLHYNAQISKEQAKDNLRLFSDGKLLPYGEILVLSRWQISFDAKILLPFWFTVPILSWIVCLILRPPKENKQLTPTAQAQQKSADEDSIDNSTKNIYRQEFRAAASSAEIKLVPTDSTLDREMDSYAYQWNNLLDKQLRKNLTENVNSFVRDYMRKALRTIKPSTISLDYIQNLADTIMTNSVFKEIADKKQLKSYIELYIVRIIENL